MGVHRISLSGALLLIVIAILLLVIIGPVGILPLIPAAILLYWAFDPGARRRSS